MTQKWNLGLVVILVAVLCMSYAIRGGVGMSRLAMVAYELMLLHSSLSKSEMSLMTASELGSGYLVEQHLHKGVNVDVRGKNDWTAVMLSSGKGHGKVVEKLLGKGASMTCSISMALRL